MDASLVRTKSFEFALSVIRLYKKLQAREEVILSSQLLKSGTGIGVNLEEALTDWEPTSRYSLLRAAKDARETRYWLKLLQESRLADVDVSAELSQVDELVQLLGKLVQPEISRPEISRPEISWIEAGDTPPLGEL